MKYPAMKLLMIIFSLPSLISISVCRRVVGGMELLVPEPPASAPTDEYIEFDSFPKVEPWPGKASVSPRI